MTQETFAILQIAYGEMAYPVLRHRILVNFKAEAQRIAADEVTKELLKKVPEPKSPLS